MNQNVFDSLKSEMAGMSRQRARRFVTRGLLWLAAFASPAAVLGLTLTVSGPPSFNTSPITLTVTRDDTVRTNALNVAISSSDTNLAFLSATNLVIPILESSVNVDLFLGTQTGSVTITASATGYVSGSFTYIIYSISNNTAVVPDQPSIAVDSGNHPIVAYSALDSLSVLRIYVKRWTGQDPTPFGIWFPVTNDWEGFNGSDTGSGISLMSTGAREPSVAVSGSKVFVAWCQVDTTNSLLDHIFLEYFNGATWTNLGASDSGLGISSNTTYSANQPTVRVASDGWPVVCWSQGVGPADIRSLIGKWDPVQLKWVGFGASLTQGVPTNGGLSIISGPDMILDSAGFPVIAWQDVLSQHIVVYRWNGALWGNIGTLGTHVYARTPRLALGPDGLDYITWIEAPSYTYPSEMVPQVAVARYSGGTWNAIGGSMNYAAISSTNGLQAPYYPSIAVSWRTNVFVSWQAGISNNNTISVKQWKPGDPGWTSVAGAGGFPGIVTNGTTLTKPAIVAVGHLPFAAFNSFDSNSNGTPSQVLTYKVAGDTQPPVFAGLQGATVTTGTVTLSWFSAVDSSTTILYRIFRGPPRACADADIMTCNSAEVFTNLIATVVNGTNYVVNSVASNMIYCFGVQAEDTNGYRDANTMMISAGPYPCGQFDTNGLPFVWESVQGITNGAGDTDGDGVSNSNEWRYGTDPWSRDTDNDGLSDSNEIFVSHTDPTMPDTDMDGLDDGMDPNPLNADSRSSTVGVPLGISDGDVYQLGYGTNAVASVYSNLLYENFETTYTVLTNRGWRHYVSYGYDLWHLSTADPSPKSGNTNVTYLFERSTNHSFRMAYDPTGADPTATYNNGHGVQIGCALEAPVLDASSVSNLYLGYNEYFETEAGWDFVQVQAKAGTGQTWSVVGETRSGASVVTNPVSGSVSTSWVHRVVDLNAFAGQSNVSVRFFFFTENAIDFDYHGWYVDDVRVYGGGAEVHGWVRDNNGAPLQNVQVTVLGSGGLTNVWQGHAYVRPGKIFASVVTSNDGSYVVRGLPWGRYFVKAGSSAYRTEFYNGPLFAPPYGFGQGLNPGVYDVGQVSTNAGGGWLDLRNPNSITNCHFELERGSGRSFLSVAVQQSGIANLPVVANMQTTVVWNGIASTSTAAFVTYTTSTNASVANNRPDWETNAVKPSMLGDLPAGSHIITLGGAGLPFFPLPEVELREAELFRTILSTNQGRSQISVVVDDGGSYPVLLDGRTTAFSTPVVIPVKAGDHLISIGAGGVPPQHVLAPLGYRTGVFFRVLSPTVSSLFVQAVDVQNNAVVGASIIVDGVTVAGANTPALVPGLRPGVHSVGIRKSGFKLSESEDVVITSNVTATFSFVLQQADEDYDQVGDFTEISAYTNVFLYSRSDDPDHDGLSNLFEFDMYRLFGIRMNLFDRDSDHDGMTDGQEVGFDGFTNRFALSTVYTNVSQGASNVLLRFVGEYLAGVDNFGTGIVAASINGDLFVALELIHPNPVVPSVDPALSVLRQIPPSVQERAVDQGHNAGERIFADTMPDQVDSDGDGMWDGFEYVFMNSTNMLNPIEARNANADPDLDGLSNYKEFLGPDGIANTNDWTNPNKMDTDGDGMPDGWEYNHGLNPNDPTDAGLDPDHDGLINLLEFQNGTDPQLADSDADGLPDGAEVLTYHTNPLKFDTDNDGLSDGQEVWSKIIGGVYDGGYKTDPLKWDTDGGGIPDGFEVLDTFGNPRPPDKALDPLNPYDDTIDSDGDGLNNLQEYLVMDGLFGNLPGKFNPAYAGVVWDYPTDPFNPDSDGDGLPDGWEVMHGLHPMDPIPTSQGPETRYADLGPSGDPDGDGLANGREFNIRFHLDPNANPYSIDGMSTDPWNPDTDGDGLGDGEEDRAFRSNPILQDSDADGLMDGTAVTGRWGEVESALRQNQFLVVASNETWQQALQSAQIPHPVYTNIIGHLAVLSSADNANIVANYLTPGMTNVAIGGTDDGSGLLNWSWVTYQYFDWVDALSVLPVSISNGVPNYLVLNSGGTWSAITTQFVDHFIVEWDDVPVVTNHFDLALNDLWMLTWSSLYDLPSWQKVKLTPGSSVPQPRWGAAMTYIPVFETKNPKNSNTGTILMDNRKLVLMGGRDGVTKDVDVWEYSVRSNTWTQSIAPLNGASPAKMDGLSEQMAATIFGYKNTGSCDCGKVPATCGGTGFGEPKDRPWPESRSFDWTYVLGGWDNLHGYQDGWWVYKSTDSRDVRESMNTEDYAIFASGGVNFVAESITQFGTLLMPLGQYTFGSTNFTGTNAFHFTGLGGLGRCETLEHAQIVFEFFAPPAANINLQILGELTYGGVSTPDYITYPPNARFTAQGWPFNTTAQSFTIPAGTTAWTQDVTQIMQQMITNTAFHVGWDGSSAGFIVYATSATSYGLLGDNASHLDVTYLTHYAVNPYWKTPGLYVVVNEDSFDWWKRKSAAMVYDYKDQKLVLFGGMDGLNIYGDTHEGVLAFTAPPDFNPDTITWTKMTDLTNSPSPRWGHSMAYDARNGRVILFGGFDAEHRPLNDLWVYTVSATSTSTATNENGTATTVTNEVPGQWRQITNFQNGERPQPRGGASMIYFGDFDYSGAVGADYCVGGHGRKIVLFGGTDGKTYFNDTWVYDDQSHQGGVTNDGRWILVNPVGESSKGPSPRAFASMAWAQNGRKVPDPTGSSNFRTNEAYTVTNGDGSVETYYENCAEPAAFLFGGRKGTLPTGPDTDGDLVSDGTEYALGGPAAGRDPRINRLVEPSQTNETIPFAFSRLGPVKPGSGRGAIADMEALRNDDGVYAGQKNLPYENHAETDAVVHVLADLLQIGVDARTEDQTALWYHRYGFTRDNEFDPRDVWQLGVPDGTNQGANGAPPYAHSGRWCFGTGLSDKYPNSAIMTLYTPKFDLPIPPNNSTTNTYTGTYYLQFYEWLDLADSNDVVSVDVIRPTTPAEVQGRLPGTVKPEIVLIGNRNCAFNTTGEWRRVVVPMQNLANESNLFARFILQSDDNGNAGGWYIDDVSILQASQISGVITNWPGVDVVLYGENYNGSILDKKQTDGSGAFQFDLLPLGSYQVGTVGTSFGPFALTYDTNSISLGATNAPAVAFTAMFGTPRVITWNAVPGLTYRIQYAFNVFGPWFDLPNGLIVGSGPVETYYDYSGDASRMYRILLISSP